MGAVDPSQGRKLNADNGDRKAEVEVSKSLEKGPLVQHKHKITKR